MYFIKLKKMNICFSTHETERGILEKVKLIIGTSIHLLPQLEIRFLIFTYGIEADIAEYVY